MFIYIYSEDGDSLCDEIDSLNGQSPLLFCSHLTNHCGSIAYSIVGGSVMTRSRGFWTTRTCPLSNTHLILIMSCPVLLPATLFYIHSLSDFYAVSKAPVKYIPNCYNHCSDAVYPVIFSVTVHILQIGIISMYWEILFCHIIIYYLTGTVPPPPERS